MDGPVRRTGSGGFLVTVVAVVLAASAQQTPAATVGDDALRITVEETTSGAAVTSILAEGDEMLVSGGATELFVLSVLDPATGSTVTVPASSGWGSVSIQTSGDTCTVELGAPSDASLPPTLGVEISVTAASGRSRWDLSVTGLDTASLEEVVAPRLALIATASHTLLLPRYTGILIPDPAGAALDWDEIYPAGWHASMQFFALWTGDRGLYLGFHDPDASTKYLAAQSAPGSVVLSGRMRAPDRTVAGNDWAMPGVFELDLFHGDWYDAARIYGRWAREEASFWPDDDPGRPARLASLAAVDVWATFGGGYDPAVVREDTLEFQQYMGFPVGLTWYEWNGKPFDDDYPEFFPELPGMTQEVAEMQAADVTVIPYINGRLFDRDLDGSGELGLVYATDGRPGAAKHDDGSDYGHVFGGNMFSYMCPTWTAWQDVLVAASDRLTRTIGTAGVYIDMVGAASPVECMDPSHGHPVGGGAWWSSGYQEMNDRIHEQIPDGRFLTTEGGADAFLDDYEGFMVQGWQFDNMVPAFQAAFAGQVVLFGMKTGVSQYDEQQFYSKLAHAFVHGFQLGRFYTSIIGASGADAEAPVFVRRLGRIHHKVSEVVSHGGMLHPLTLSAIPAITTTWTHTYDGDIEVTTPAVETSTWARDENGERTVVILLVNASMTDTVQFDLPFDAGEHGLEGTLSVQELGELSDGPVTHPQSPFIQQVTLDPLAAVAWRITGDPVPVRWVATGDPSEICGDGDAIIEPGEEWAVPLTVDNPDVLDHVDVHAPVTLAAGTTDVTLTAGDLVFGSVAAGSSATASFRFLVERGAACGATVAFDLGAIAWDTGGIGPGRSGVASFVLGGGAGVCDATAPCDAPVAGFEVPAVVCADSPVTFTDRSLSAVVWSWDLDGDGSEDATDPSPTTTYADAGVVTVTQTVTDRNGRTDALSHQVTVSGVTSAVPGDLDADGEAAAADLAAWIAELADGDGPAAGDRCLGFPTTGQSDSDHDGDIDPDDLLGGVAALFS